MYIGAHQSISGGIYKSIERASYDQCEALQVFTKNSNRWAGKELDEETAEKFRSLLAGFGESRVCAHASYLINLASYKEDTYSKSLISCADELGRCDRLKIPYYVIHPGSHVGEGEARGISRVAESVDLLYSENDFKCMILFEITAGMGTNLGCRLEHMEDIMAQSKFEKNIGLCLDSCHMYCAGYDIVGNYDEVFDDICGRFGDKLKVFHLNDTKFGLGSKKDRHQLIGQGEIGSEFFEKCVNDERFKDVLGILETPIGEGQTYIDEVKLLKSMRTRG